MFNQTAICAVIFHSYMVHGEIMYNIKTSVCVCTVPMSCCLCVLECTQELLLFYMYICMDSQYSPSAYDQSLQCASCSRSNTVRVLLSCSFVSYLKQRSIP